MDAHSILSFIITFIYFGGNISAFLALIHFRKWGWIILLVAEVLYTAFQFVNWVIILDISLASYLSNFAVKLIIIFPVLYGWVQWGRYPQPKVPFFDTKIFQQYDTEILDNAPISYTTSTYPFFLTNILKKKLFFVIGTVASCCYVLLMWWVLDSNWLYELSFAVYVVGLTMLALRAWQSWIALTILYIYYVYSQISYAITEPEYLNTETYVYGFLNVLLLLITIYGTIYWYNYYKQQQR